MDAIELTAVSLLQSQQLWQIPCIAQVASELPRMKCSRARVQGAGRGCTAVRGRRPWHRVMATLGAPAALSKACALIVTVAPVMAVALGARSGHRSGSHLRPRKNLRCRESLRPRESLCIRKILCIRESLRPRESLCIRDSLRPRESLCLRKSLCIRQSLSIRQSLRPRDIMAREPLRARRRGARLIRPSPSPFHFSSEVMTDEACQIFLILILP
tara:strand:- start:357 stop:1001 length:645 start_codon:yes stop_codon:yes gene_type:complete